MWWKGIRRSASVPWSSKSFPDITAGVGADEKNSVGRFVAAALKHPEESFGKALKVQSFVVTPNEVVKEYERQTGEKWEVVETTLDEHKKLETKLWEESHPAAVSATLRRIWAEGGTLYAKNDNEVVGLGDKDLDSLEVAVKKALAGGYKNDTF